MVRLDLDLFYFFSTILYDIFPDINRMGAHYRVDKPSTSQGEQKFKVVKIITHESYNKPKDMSHDVALLKLESPATLDE